MSHLTDEQIEQRIEAGPAGEEHLSSCPLCRQRLQDALALRRRLRQAHEAIHADVILEHQILASVRSAVRKSAPRRVWTVLRRARGGLAAAAAILLAAGALSLYLAGPQPVQAASVELAQIHQSNLMPHAALHGSSDPAQVADYLRKELGFVPAMPRLGAGMGLRGCCVAHFRNRPVGSYVIDTDRGIVSIIVLRDKPDSLDFAEHIQRQGRTYYTGAFARCRMAAVQIGGYTYCAVGETDVPWLVELLQSLLADRPAPGNT